MAELKDAYKSTAYWMLIFSTPFFLIMVFFPGEILSLFGPGFEKGQACLIVLAFGQIVNTFCGANGSLLMMTGHQRWMVFNGLILIILTIGLSLYLIPAYGILGAAYANTVSIIIANVIVTLEVYFLLKVHPYNQAYFKILILGLITTAMTFLMRNLSGNKSLIMASLEGISVLVIFFFLVIFFGMGKNERRFLNRITAKIRSIKP
jgi:O-antigen/teichoic acid export membrane protein